MTKITTADCKAFIVDFVTKNPSVILSIYGSDLSAADKIDLINDATNAANWKRESKRKVNKNDTYEVYNINVPVRRCQYDGTTTVSGSNFVVEREFCLCPNKYENGIQFTILEKLDRSLVFGPYSGD